MKEKQTRGGWAFYKRRRKDLRAVVVFISAESHAKLKHQAYLEERTFQKVLRRIIEDAAKGLPIPPEQ